MRVFFHNAGGSAEPGCRRGRIGFTLIEMLMVIMIIVLLVGMLLPTVARIRVEMMISRSRADIAIIATGCQLYYDDYERQFPPSDWGTGDAGGKRLVHHLVGDGKSYGCDSLKMVEDRLDQDDSFGDQFGHPILYYRFDKEAGIYDPDDNPSGPIDAENTYAKFYDGALRHYRTDFLLMSAGPDAVFRDPKLGEDQDGDPENSADDIITDDITNFLRR
jgi:prepilin-type N-terminal cleavage/methylation domain-containing protein